MSRSTGRGARAGDAGLEKTGLSQSPPVLDCAHRRSDASPDQRGGNPMVHRPTLFVALLGLALLAAGPGAARAQECALGCASQLKACVRNSRADAFGCELTARRMRRPRAAPACGLRRRVARRPQHLLVTARSEACVDTCAPTLITPDQQSCLPLRHGLGRVRAHRQ
ncbi:MAG: hypothetical protein U0802_01925 [Candidatus Binatia bacterium]